MLCVLVAAAAALVFSERETKKYTATASLAFNTNPLGQQIAGLPNAATSSSDLVAQQASNVELVKGGGVAPETARLLGHGLTAEKVFDSVSVAGKGESDVVAISATSASPALAAAIASTYASEFVKDQQQATRRYYKSALALVRKQLAVLSPQQRIGPDGLELQDRAQTLALLTGLKESSVQVAAEALVPASPSSPKTSKNVVLGGFLGLLVGLSLAFALERFDRRIRRREDLEDIYQVPFLGGIPERSTVSRSGLGVLPSTEAEAFNLVRAHLRFFNVDRDLRTVLVASPALGDGKTTIARHLAVPSRDSDRGCCFWRSTSANRRSRSSSTSNLDPA